MACCSDLCEDIKEIMGNSSPVGRKGHKTTGWQQAKNSENDIQELVEMGFSEPDARSALKASKGNLQLASDVLLRSCAVNQRSAAPKTTWNTPDEELQKALQLSYEESYDFKSQSKSEYKEDGDLERALKLSLRDEEMGSSDPPPPDSEIRLRPIYEAKLASYFEHVNPADFFPTMLKVMVVFKRKAHEAHDRVVHRHESEPNDQSSYHAKASPRRHLSREESIEQGKKLLKERLQNMKLKYIQMYDDGNCQFRAFSQELYGTQKYHGYVRERAIDYIKRHQQDFSVFFSEGEFGPYIQKMSRSKTWGDELTLKAVAEEYGIKVHVITSTEENWYLHYDPEQIKIEKQVFLTYVSPIHYNCIEPGHEDDISEPDQIHIGF